ncbi:MAG: hypothetical protein EOP51_27005, partial [Sphingobacteriales bacterium]
SLPATTVDPNLTASPITRGPDITPNAGGNSFNSTGWTTSVTLESTKYVTVTLTPNPTYALTLTQFTFDSQRSNSGPQTWSVRSSLDNFASDLATFQMVTGTNVYQDQVVNLAGVVTNVTNPVEFRIYAYNATTGGTFRVSDLKFYGSVNPSGPATSLSFVGNATTVAEDAATTSVQVSIANPDATNATTVDVVVTGGSATAGTDFTYTTQTLTFPAGSSANQTVTVNITDDTDIESDETITLSLQNASTGVVLGTSNFTVTITDNDTPPPVIPLYTIASVTTNDANGLPDSLGVNMRLRGIAHGINNRTTGYQFTLIDNTGGIGIFSNANIAGYTYAEGDSLEVTGTMAQFNGLAQLNLTAVQVINSGNPLFPATIVTTLSEASESELVRLANPVYIVDPTQWTGSGSGFTVNVSDGTNTYAMRITSATDLYAQSAPAGWFYLTGIGGQFDGSAPHTDGYQIAPRYASDLQLLPLVGFSATTQQINETAGTATLTLTIANPATAAFTVLVSATGGTATNGSDFTFTNQTVTFPANSTTSQTVTVNITDDTMVEGNETIIFTISNPSTTIGIGNTTQTLTIVDNDVNGMEEVLAGSLKLYPNPASSNVMVELGNNASATHI